MAWLRCENTIRKTVQSAPLRKVLTTIGRAPGNDVVLDDPMVAGTHANVVRQGGAYSVHLVDKVAELYVNGQRVKKADLKDGDRLLFGAWQVTFGEGEPAEASAPKAEGLGLDVL